MIDELTFELGKSINIDGRTERDKFFERYHAIKRGLMSGDRLDELAKQTVESNRYYLTVIPLSSEDSDECYVKSFLEDSVQPNINALSVLRSTLSAYERICDLIGAEDHEKCFA